MFVSVNSELESKSDKSVDEIKDYLDARYISAIEGVWHIFHFLMRSQDPPVMRLDTHLEDQNSIIYNDNDKMSNFQTKQRNTKLTAWFELKKTDISAKDILYHDIPKYYVWKPHLRIWSRRKHSKVTNMIGRMYFINPSNIEAFSLRLILLHHL